MKKIFFLVFSLFLLTGCTANYDLYIGEKLTDDLFLLENTESLENIDYYDMKKGEIFNIDNLTDQIQTFEKGFNYNREEVTEGDKSGYRYNYTYNFDEMDKKSMIYDCYDNISITTGKKITIETSDEFRCFDKYDLLDEVNVNIHYLEETSETNADSYKDGVYSWKITRDNYMNKKIYISFDPYKKNYIFDIIGGIILVVLIIILAIFVKKNRYKS